MLQTTGLSASAVAVLRFKIKGFKMPITEQRLPSFRELAAAGIMEPVSGADGTPEADYRFTAEGFELREEILRAEEDRIERERYTPPVTDLSDAARETLRRHLADDTKVTSENLPAYRELAKARIMIPLSGFVGGPESSFRLTYWGYKLRFELAGMSCLEEVASPD